jgi:hypothetical protein
MWDFLFHSAVAWLGIGGLAIVGLAVAAWFIPGFRMLALEIGGGILAATAIYAKGNRDEVRKWSEAEQRAVDKGTQARADAMRDVGADPSGVRNDKFNRDQG